MRLIDADAFEVISWQAQGGGEWASGFDEGVSYVVGKIDDAPTIDAAPVIRCKDCRFCFDNSTDRMEPYSGGAWWYCERWDRDTNVHGTDPERFYCADAERRDDT